MTMPAFARFFGRGSEFYRWPGGVRAAVRLPFGALVQVLQPTVMMSGSGGNFPGSIVRYNGVNGYVPKRLLLPELQTSTVTPRPFRFSTGPVSTPTQSDALYALFQSAQARGMAKVASGYYNQYLQARARETLQVQARLAFR
jgi:hypothetical protein